MSLDPATGIVSAKQVTGQGGYAVTVKVSDSTSPTPSIATATLNFGVNSDSTYGGCQMFPADSVFNQRIDSLPVDTNPAHQMSGDNLTSVLHPDFGGGFYPGPGGIPFMRVPANQPSSSVTLANDGQIDAAGTYSWPFPAWPNAAIEGTSYGLDGDDHHLLVLQSSVNNINGPQSGACTLYETYQSTAVPSMYNAGSNTWSMSTGVHYQLNSDQIAASEATLDTGAQDVAGIPILPLLVKYSEVPLAAQHPLRISLTSTNGFVWPATGCCTGNGPPLGALLRLKADVNWQSACPVSTNPQAATVLQALQQYGAYVSVHNTGGYIQGVPDVRWNDSDLACIGNFPLSDLEVVNNSTLEVSDISGQTRPYVVSATLASGTVGTAYNAAITENGGNPATLQWTVSSGALPPGLLLNAAGAISGTPSSTGGSPFGFSITAKDTNSGYSSQAQVFSIGVTPGSQTITFAVPPSAAFGTSPTLTATATSNLPVSFASTTSNICTVSGATVTLVAVGTCATQVTQAGNTSWAAATPVSQSFQVTQGSQTISFGALSSAAMGAAPTVSATATSGLTVSFNSQTTPVCTISGTTVTLVSVGTCIIQATQLGNSNWAAAAQVSQGFSVTSGSQTITFGALPNTALSTGSLIVGATSTSGLPVSFNSQTPSICTVAGTTVTLVSVGTCTIQATDAATTNWAAAVPVNQSFSVTPGGQTITFGALANAAFGTSPTLTATATSHLPVIFNSLTTSICTVSGTTVTLVTVGTCTIQATQLGNANWAVATPVSRSFSVTSLPCDLEQNGNITVTDLQLVINEVLGVATARNDLNGDGVVSVADVQIEINAELGHGCLGSYSRLIASNRIR
jgi:hypothetical protein